MSNGISTEPIHSRQHIYSDTNYRKMSWIQHRVAQYLHWLHTWIWLSFRDKIIEWLNKYEIPSELIKLIARTLQDTKARVKVNQNYTEKIEITTGVQHGDLLPGTLFGIVIDDILKQLELRGNISIRLRECSAYADDILITAWIEQW